MFPRVSESLILVESANQSHRSQIVAGRENCLGQGGYAASQRRAHCNIFPLHGICVCAIALVLRFSTTGLAAKSKIHNIANMISSRQDTSSPTTMRLLTLSMT